MFDLTRRCPCAPLPQISTDMDFFYFNAVQHHRLPKGMLNFDAFCDLTLDIAVRYFGGVDNDDNISPLTCMQTLLAPVIEHLNARGAQTK